MSVVSTPSARNAVSRYRARGSSLPGGFVVSKRIRSRSRETVSGSAAFQSGDKQLLDLPRQRSEGKRRSARAFRDLFRRLTLPFRQQLPHEPAAGVGVSEPVVVESLHEVLVENRLQLP